MTNEEEQEAAELELFIQYQLEQERQDQHDLKLFYHTRQEEEKDADKATRLMKKGKGKDNTLLTTTKQLMMIMTINQLLMNQLIHIYRKSYGR